MLILPGERFNLAGEALDACIQVAPVSGQLLDDTRDAGLEDIGSRGQDARQLDPQETQSLPYRNAALQQEGADRWSTAGPSHSRTSSAAFQGSHCLGLKTRYLLLRTSE